MEIFPGLHFLSVQTPTLPPHRATNCYVLTDGGQTLVIDAITPEAEFPQEDLAAAGVASITLAAVTHPHHDHHRGLDRLLGRFGGRVLCHELALPRMGYPAGTVAYAEPVRGGEVLSVGRFSVRVLHTPGHSPDHICLYLEGEKTLFSGDTILGWGTSIISPPDGNMTAYMKTLEMLAGLDLDLVCPGHGPLIREKAGERIQWYIAHRLMRENKVLGALAEGWATTREIAERIYTEEDFAMHGRDLLPRAERSVLAHLEKLVEENRVVREESGGRPRFRLAASK
jgi:glyoxylase-like metal-dependent hydrolase (beta-lactamase superfamily II)